MKKLLIAGIAVFTTGLIGSAQADAIVMDTNSNASCLAQSSSSHNMGNSAGSTGGYGGSPTFYDSSRMTNLAENLKRVTQGDTIQITRSRADLVARRVLNFTTEYTVVKSSDPNDPHLAIQVKPYGGNVVRTLTFNDWKQFVLNDRGVNFHLHCA
ncbi:MAG: hypothetical protein K0U40_05665 [Betaproteobacteria bacterium]|nr:hypothetical protein [Betaproteobacteria bacterium]